MMGPEITARGVQVQNCDEVCSLPDDARQDRSTMFRTSILPHVMRREALANGWALEFDYNLSMEKTLEDFVAFERGCCGALMWTLARPSHRVLRLSIEGLPPDSPFFLEMGGAQSERSG